MPFFKSKDVKIVGIAATVPDNMLNKEDFSRLFGEDTVYRFVKSTGIESVYRALPEQTASDLGYEAAEKLLATTEIDRTKIGLMIFVTQSPDYRRPASACVLQKRLGLSIDCAAMDIGLGCSGFIYGHQTITSMMQTTDAQYALLILGETASKLVNPHDKSIAMMYGDAGAAILYQRDKDKNENYTLLKSDGNRFKSIILPAGGFRDMYPARENIVCHDGIERSKYDIYMDGVAVFSFSTTDVPDAIEEYLDYTQTCADDYDLILLHQANKFIIKQIGKKIKAPIEKLPVSLEQYGNTGGISIPLTICDYVKKHKCESETLRILASGFGIGLSWGVTSFEISTSSILEVSKTANSYNEGVISPSDY